jgi:hypothetical protein
MQTYQGRDSSVGIATLYGPKGPRIAARLGQDVPYLPTPTVPPPPAFYTMGTVLFPEVKRRRCGVDHPPPCNAEVKERVELYHYPLP